MTWGRFAGIVLLLAPLRSPAESAILPEPAPKPWLRWLGPLAPQSGALPEVPSPLRDPGQIWTMEKALARALQANADVQVALAGVQRQDGLRLQTVSQLLPRIGVTATMDKRDPSLIDRTAFELSSPPTLRTAVAERSFDVRIDARQTLFDGLSGWNQVKRMALLKRKASVDARDLYLRTASQVRQDYDAVIFREMVVGTRREAVRDLGHLADVAQKRLAVGDISEYESLRAASALRSAEADLAQADSDLARAQEALCRMLNIDKPAEGLRLTGAMTALSYADTFERALVRAQTGRPDLRSAELQLDAARLAQRAVTGGYLPRVEAYVDYVYRSSYYDYQRQLQGWTAGLVGRWDVFDSGQTLGSSRTQRAERRMAEIRVAEAKRLIGSQIRELFAGLDQAKTLMAAHQSARDLGERSVREARRLYEVGRISLEQVLNAELGYRQSYVGWLGAVFTFNATVYQLDYATANEAFLDAVAAAAR